MQNHVNQVGVCQKQEGIGLQKDNNRIDAKSKAKYAGIVLIMIVNRQLSYGMRRLSSWRFKKSSMAFGAKIINSLSCRGLKRTFFNLIKQFSLPTQHIKPQNIPSQESKQLMPTFLISPYLYTNPSQQEFKRICQIIKIDLTKPFKNMTPENKKRMGLVEQEFINKMLMAEIKELKQEIDSLNKRQERENTKKKESLEMLAQELQEKNQVIQDLKRSLNMYQQRFSTANNILDTDLDSLRKQLQNSERIRQKLENDFDTTKSKLQTATAELKKAKSQIQTLTRTIKQIRTTHEQNKLKNQQLTKSQSQLDKLIKSIRQKSKQINFYLKEMENKQHVHVEKVQFLENQVKLEILFDYLANFGGIQEPNYTLFNSEEINILEKHRLEWAEAGKQFQDFQAQQYAKDQDVQGIIGKGIHQHHHHSIFQFLDSPHNQIQTNNKNKALKVELEKNRLYEQITELKSKILHIRDVVLNFLKTLDFQVGKKSEAQPVLELIFEIFQYSEQQRHGIFVKKKKFFSFM